MSKRRKGKVNQALKPAPITEIGPEKVRVKLHFDKKWWPIIFFTGFVFLFVLFLMNLSRNPDFENELIRSKAGLIPFQYFIFSLLACCFGYFSWRHLTGDREINRLDQILILMTFLSITGIYIGAFNREISPNGDNAEYMIIAKSLVERGSALRLETPSETPNSLASLGLPLMLTPIYAIWGLDTFKMKVMITLLGLAIFFLLYRLFENRQGFALATLLSAVAVTSPYMVGNSTDVMTETPYLFWSLVAMLIILRYQETRHFQWKYYFLVITTIVMTYLTRAVGIGALAALLLFLAWNVSWSKIFNRDQRREMFRSTDFKKLWVIMVPLVIGAIIWQIWQHSKGISQATLFFSNNITQHLELNCRSAFRVLGQMLFNPETFRFQNFYRSATLGELDFKFSLVLVLMLIGLIAGLRQRKLIAGYSLIVFCIIMLASLTPAEMVIMRYVSILLPFIIYFTFAGAGAVLQFISRKLRLPGGTAFASVGSLLVLAQILFTNMQGNSVNMTLSTVGNGPAYHDYIDVAKWAKNNLPDTAYVVAVKPRLFYLLSEKKSTRLSTIEESYSKEFEEAKLKLFKRLKITHVVLDGISGSTRENIFPIVKNRPEMFQTLYIGSTSGTSSISKIIYPND